MLQSLTQAKMMVSPQTDSIRVNPLYGVSLHNIKHLVGSMMCPFAKGRSHTDCFGGRVQSVTDKEGGQE